MAHAGQWSTEKYDEVLAHLNRTGTLPKLNPFFNGEVDWRAPNVHWSYTNEEMLELAKSKSNILYFGETYCKVMTDDGIKIVKLRSYQRKVLQQFKKYRNNVYCASRQIGKCVEFDTEVDISETLSGEVVVSIPLFELYYKYKQHLSIADHIEWAMYRAAYFLKSRIKLLRSRLA